MSLYSVKSIINNKIARQGRLLIISWLITVWSPILPADNLLNLWKIAELQDAKYLSASHSYRSDQKIVKFSRADLLPSIDFQKGIK